MQPDFTVARFLEHYPQKSWKNMKTFMKKRQLIEKIRRKYDACNNRRVARQQEINLKNESLLIKSTYENLMEFALKKFVPDSEAKNHTIAHVMWLYHQEKQFSMIMDMIKHEEDFLGLTDRKTKLNSSDYQSQTRKNYRHSHGYYYQRYINNHFLFNLDSNIDNKKAVQLIIEDEFKYSIDFSLDGVPTT